MTTATRWNSKKQQRHRVITVATPFDDDFEEFPFEDAHRKQNASSDEPNLGGFCGAMGNTADSFSWTQVVASNISQWLQCRGGSSRSKSGKSARKNSSGCGNPFFQRDHSFPLDPCAPQQTFSYYSSKSSFGDVSSKQGPHSCSTIPRANTTSALYQLEPLEYTTAASTMTSLSTSSSSSVSSSSTQSSND